MKRNYIGYVRVSTAKQGQSGLGLQAQRDAVMSYVGDVGGHLVDTVTEVQSGAKEDRTGLEQALLQCELTGSTLVVAKLDRLSRNFSQIAKLLEMTYVRIICADSPNDDSFVLRIKAAVAAEERQKISERTRAALAAKKKAGFKLGNPNIRKIRNSNLTNANEVRKQRSNDWQLKMYRMIQEVECYESLSIRKLAHTLNDKGYKTQKGCAFSQTQVYRILKTGKAINP